jgi:addiction module HigA family antidote
MKKPRRAMPPVHPGEILMEDFLKPRGITQYRLARSIDIHKRCIGEIVTDKIVRPPSMAQNISF